VDFVDGHFDVMQPLLRRVIRYMSWIDDRP
jgi:hypothetical protein